MSDIIKPMLCLSTAHLKPETFQLLANDEIECCIFYQKVDCSTGECYGGWLYISDCGSSDSIDQHEDLKALVDYCDSKDIEWVMFDADEDENANLPVYNEEWTAYAKEELGNMMLK